MKKRIVMILVLLLLGAVINVAVAWGFAVRSNPEEISPEAYWEIRKAGPASLPTINGRLPVIRNAYAARGLLIIEIFDEGPMLQSRDGTYELIAGVAYRAGWPLLSMQGSYRSSPRNGSVWTGFVGSRSSGPGTPETFRNALPLDHQIFSSRLHSWSRGKRLLPLRPTWPGFAVNSLLYAGLLWILFVGSDATRRVVRIKRGRCPMCAYDLRGHRLGESPHPQPLSQGERGVCCPECGWNRETIDAPTRP